MKKLIDRFLDWLKIKPKAKPVEAWPFPSEEAIAKVEAVKKKPAVKKATTRPAAKKATTVAKKATPKKAK
jgi:hypothetical protein